MAVRDQASRLPGARDVVARRLNVLIEADSSKLLRGLLRAQLRTERRRRKRLAIRLRLLWLWLDES